MATKLEGGGRDTIKRTFFAASLSKLELLIVVIMILVPMILSQKPGCHEDVSKCLEEVKQVEKKT